MSQNDPKDKKPEASAAPVQKPANASKPPQNAKPGTASKKPGGNGWVLAVVAIAVAAAGASALVIRSAKSPAPVANASEEEIEATDIDLEAEAVADSEMEEEEAPEEEEVETAAAPRAPTKGTLVVRSDVKGADVFLNGRRVGKTPHQAKGLTPGSYDVKVEKDGYEPYETKIKVTAKRRELTAKLTPASATLKVASNVDGAKVLLDGEERGTTPLSLQDLPPGRHELTISASGYRTYTETLELTGGAREVSVDLVSPLADLNEAVAVKHKHRFGSCEGILRATASGIVYESDHKDAFSVDLSEIGEIELDGDELSLKVEGGRNYNFSERNENPDALAGFYDRVKEAIRIGGETP